MKDYVMTPSNQTLTQSGLLALLLQRQRRKVIELARRRAHCAQMRMAFGNYPRLAFGARSQHHRRSTVSPRLWRKRSAAYLKSFIEAMTMSHQIHTYTELREQIHDDLRIQHPEWVQLDGESPMCDSYEVRLVELLDALPRRDARKPSVPDRRLSQR